ncbi:cysteine protease atg4da-like isoform X3 [Neoarius graeffei]|uniref:cysteine protease atg4da-like isoform X3 n=1 Tax=Neoarius graeffei TaxID=443677 RepID=UPI00298C2F87|nr:cysteine protease atg4da-like isoform X3 [Neoarius graeffei]
MTTSVCPDEVNAAEDLESFEFLSYPGPSEYTRCSETVKDKTRLRSRLVSAWNNVKYRGWNLKAKPRLSKNSPVCMLGHTYNLNHEGERQLFRCAFSSLFWMTYRRGFSSLQGTSLTSDSGWGCTVRSAQMLLAQALVRHTLPAGWTWTGAHHQTRDDLELGSSRPLGLGLGRSRRVEQRRRSEGAILEVDEDGQESRHRRLVAWFGDTPSAPFSLHQLVGAGQSSGQRAGDWYGPSVAAHMLRKAVAASELRDLAVYVAQDCTEDQLLYLDPHFCRAAVDVRQSNFPLESFHCKTARKLPFNRMDPSCTLGFYVKSRRDFDMLRSDITMALSSSTDMYPIFTFVEGSGRDQHEQLDLTFDPEVHVPLKDKERRRRSKGGSMDEFVLL